MGLFYCFLVPRKQLNLSCSWLAFLVLRPAQTSHQRFSDSRNSPSLQVRRLRSDIQQTWFTHSHQALSAQTCEQEYNLQYYAIHWLNDDVLLSIFDCYRLDEKNGWNDRLGWCKLSHVCQRWRQLIYECTSYLGMHIKCTNGSPIVDTLDHLPSLPLFVDYRHIGPRITMLTEQDELGIYNALRLHGRVHHIDLKLPPSILRKFVLLMDEQFPILEHLSLSFSATSSKNNLPLTLPKAFLAPNLRHLTLPSINPPRRLQLLISTVSLVTLELSNIQTSSYFRPRLLVARLQFLPQLKELYIGFSVPIPRPSTERELLGEQGAPVTLPSLKCLWFRGVSAYLESLVAQIRVPLLQQLGITLFNQIAFALQHLSYLIGITVLKIPSVMIGFYRNEVYVTTVPGNSKWGSFSFRVICEPLEWKIGSAAQICHALIPALSCVEKLILYHDSKWDPSNLTGTELRNGAVDNETWHDLLRSFIGVKELHINNTLFADFSRALQVDEVGLDPGFLPNLQSIHAKDNLFASFIDTRQIVGRPVRFVSRL